MARSYFAVGNSLYDNITSEARLVARAVGWLMRHRNEDGTWGGSSIFDRLIASHNVAAALLSVGFAPTSEALFGAIKFMTELEIGDYGFAFWRSGPLLNVAAYRELVISDMNHIWRNRKRGSVSPHYPAPFFLLKLMRLMERSPTLDFTENDVLAWIMEDWDDVNCWDSQASITSMVVSLIYDMDFHDKERVLRRSREFLINCFKSGPADVGRFDENLSRHSFVVFNLCERDLQNAAGGDDLASLIPMAAKWIVSKAIGNEHWRDKPAFGGEVAEDVYTTAVAVKSLMSYYSYIDDTFVLQVASELLDKRLAASSDIRGGGTLAKPFWGVPKSTAVVDACFVLMPFQPEKLTEIYEEYVKAPIEANTKLKCIRGDDMFLPRSIMMDVWEGIYTSRVIIAELTNRNANVMYELGLAHALGKDVILIAQRDHGLPFDVSGIRSILYDDGPRGYKALTAEIMKSLAALGVV